MSRPIRFEYPGAFYHVMNRGANHNPIFLEERRDRELFLTCLGAAVKRFKIKVHAFSLMRNHYHLLIETPLGNLSRSMRHIDGVYTQRFNRFHNRDGPLLRGRYKSKLVQEGKYFLELIRYIHLNGSRAKIYPSPQQDPYCSHPYYLMMKKAPSWLTTDMALSYFRDGPMDPVGELHRFILAGLPKNIKEIMKRKKWPAILGDDRFILSIREKFIRDKKSDCERPHKNELNQWKPPTPLHIVNWVCKRDGCSREGLFKKTNPENKEARALAVFLMRRVGFMTYQDIGTTMGGVSRTTVASLLLEGEKNYDDKLTDLEKALLKYAT